MKPDSENPHIIRKHFLHVDFSGSEAEGMALRQSLSDFCRDRLMPAIERGLERCAPPEGYLQIDRLEIDTGVQQLDRLDGLVEEVSRALESAVRMKAAAGLSPAASPGVQKRTRQETVVEAFTYFLAHGRLPWWYRLPEGLDAVREVLNSPANEHLLSGIRGALSTPVARLRFVEQFSGELVADVLGLLAPDFLPVVNRMDARIVKDLGAGSSFFRKRLREVVFAEVAKGATALSEAALAREVLAKGAPLPPEIVSRLREAAEEGGQQEGPSHPESPGELAVSPDPEEDGIYVDNSGLVLLHPFLPRFLDALGVAKGDEMFQPGCALALLHFLATGQDSAPEQHLVLPKILCGLEPDAPVESGFVLSEAEKAEALALLEAVIGHWQVLKNTSPDGLRGTFLLRSGKLSRKGDGGWLLQVESQSFDFLLGSLPWGIGMIRLPWMKRMLHVEWNGG